MSPEAMSRLARGAPAVRAGGELLSRHETGLGQVSSARLTAATSAARGCERCDGSLGPVVSHDRGGIDRLARDPVHVVVHSGWLALAVPVVDGISVAVSSREEVTAEQPVGQRD